MYNQNEIDCGMLDLTFQICGSLWPSV